MKVGETFLVTNQDLLGPKLRHIFEMEVDGVKIKARLIAVDPHNSEMKVVPDEVKE